MDYLAKVLRRHGATSPARDWLLVRRRLRHPRLGLLPQSVCWAAAKSFAISRRGDNSEKRREKVSLRLRGWGRDDGGDEERKGETEGGREG